MNVDAENVLNRYISPGMKKRDQLDKLSTTALSLQAPGAIDYSMHTSIPRPTDPVTSSSPRNRIVSPPKSILKKTRRGESSLGLTGTYRVTSGHYLANQQNASLCHYPWSAPSGDQLLSVPNSETPQAVLKNPPSCPSKKVSFNF